MMKTSGNIKDIANYDTTINIIGGLKDCDVIYKAIDSFFSQDDSLHDMLANRNEFNLRTERSRTRVERAINQSFLQFRNQNHRDLMQSLFQRTVSPLNRELVLFWQFALNNQLFLDISNHVFTKIYFSGRAGISKDDIIAYLKEFLNKNKALDLQWSESTINTISTKYLNFMTKLNLLEGVRKKTFKHIKISAEMLVIFLYFAQTYDQDNKDILVNDLLPLSFVAPEDIQERLKKLALKGWFEMNSNGVTVNIELTHSYKGIHDALSH